MAPPQTPNPALDHIVVLVPPTFLTSPPPWLAESLHLSPGGRHANGITENALVLLADGSYIELIAFAAGTTPEQRRGHKWGEDTDGTVVDWALTVSAPGGPDIDRDFEFVDGITARLHEAGAGVVYGDKIPGGRLRPDGVRLEWATVPARCAAGDEDAVGHGRVPFWCLDGTPRDLRVPYQLAGATTHPSGAVGVAEVNITSGPASDDVSDLRWVYTEVLQGPAKGPWRLATIEGSGAQRNVTVRLAMGDSPAQISISLYTDRPDLAGKVLGGEGASFQFKLVGI